MKEFRLKGSDKLLRTINSFSATEKVVFGFLTIVALGSALSLAWRVNAYFLVPTPAHGGSFSEGMIGLPRSINPVLAFTETDKDLSVLIYAGLMKYNGDKLVGDLAKSYTVSDDGLVYDFKLKDNLRFHDGVALTTDDIEFTIQKIQDSDIKSPRRVDWASVSIKKISPSEIQFILKQPYTPFPSNTTIGILPKHIWKNLDADQFIFNQKNLEPIGAGPYKIDSLEKNTDGSPKSYNLSAFSKYNNGKPYISAIHIFFYADEESIINDYTADKIENFSGISTGKTAEIAEDSPNTIVIHNPLPRIFAVFLNQNNSPVLANKEIRQALDMAVDKEKIIHEVLNDYGISIDSPLALNTKKKATTVNKDGARNLLAKAGWLINSEGILEKKIGNTKQKLEFSITTADSIDLKKVAELVKKDWESLGARVSIKVFEYGDLSQNIIKTRKYDALLFGEIISKDLDLYAFWHSSQRNSPGLNISMYVNSKADKLLEDARITYDEKKRDAIHQSFEKILRDDMPAIFLYSPEYIYIMSKRIQGYDPESIANNSDRFYGIDKWYIDTDHVWKIFVKDKIQ
ncbi:MAG: ABC transporter substrate-binding protein [Candidatus Taylorbacteria bacterium]|nr:ABC transporter substrate-binding protein [Candidatus Taylorbacteria bacterium]